MCCVICPPSLASTSLRNGAIPGSRRHGWGMQGCGVMCWGWCRRPALGKLGAPFISVCRVSQICTSNFSGAELSSSTGQAEARSKVRVPLFLIPGDFGENERVFVAQLFDWMEFGMLNLCTYFLPWQMTDACDLKPPGGKPPSSSLCRCSYSTQR